jgi:hypothetical protein
MNASKALNDAWVVHQNVHNTMLALYPVERLRRDYCAWLNTWFDGRVALAEKALAPPLGASVTSLMDRSLVDELRALRHLWCLAAQEHGLGEFEPAEPSGHCWQRLRAQLETASPEERASLPARMLLEGIDRYLRAIESAGIEGQRTIEDVVRAARGWLRTRASATWLLDTGGEPALHREH